MATVDITLPHHRYTVHIEPGLIGRLGTLVREVIPHERAALLCDADVDRHWGPAAAQSLHDNGYQVARYGVPGGENHKSLNTVADLYRVLVAARLERRSPVIALGGGIIGDTVGFVAASYLRGVPFVQCPTTLLAMVDASVGGKVGVNLPEGKNLVGAFHQPTLVAIDTDTLRTLPTRELRAGLAECVKHGIIRDADLFAWIEDRLDDILRLDPATLVELVTWNVRIKGRVVMADEKETGERAHLNFGHTFAHAIEGTQDHAASDALHHGEAVAVGMVAATRLAIDTGRCDASLLDRLTNLLKRIGLPVTANLPSHDILLASMQLDKKVADGRIRFVLPDRLGAVSIVQDAPLAAVRAAWDSVRQG